MKESDNSPENTSTNTVTFSAASPAAEESLPANVEQAVQDESTDRVSRKSRISESTMMLLSAVIGGLIAAGAGYFASNKVVDAQMHVEQIKLVQTLTDEFYNNELYAEIRSAIDSCDVIYIGNGGRYTHDKINRYLGFFEDVGFYSNTKKFIDLDVVSHTVGAHLVEAYAYPELRQYVSDVQSHQPMAFTEFDLLYTRLVERYRNYGILAKNFVNACSSR